MKETDLSFRSLWQHHDHIVRNTPPRSTQLGVESTRREADGWCVTDPDINEDQFLEEGADVVISWMTTMKSAGYSCEVAIQSIYEKMNVVINKMY